MRHLRRPKAIRLSGDRREHDCADVARIVHRGPDGQGIWSDPSQGVAFGHRRLSIIDLSQAGAQPMSNEDGSVMLTYNGEVYNHAALRSELEAKGHVYRSHTDSETIVHLYEEEGPRCVERLQGMFAIAIWDARRKELFLARDRLGVKPLYYAQLPGGLVFGSEIKALLAHPAVVPELDEQALFDYLTFAFAPAPRSMFKNIDKLAPAERITFCEDGSAHSEIYWSPLSRGASQEVAEMSEPEMIERVRSLLRGSIAKRMMSDVPFGVFLSGGLDSSTNVALMSELVSEPIRTFTTAPRGHAKYDELDPARLVANHFGTDHHEIVIDEEDLAGFIPELLAQQDEPLSDWTSIPQHFVSKLARDSGTPVVQVGEGADELFHGYKGYEDHRRFFMPFQRYLPPTVRRPIGRAAEAISGRLERGARYGEALRDAAYSPIPYWGGSICFRGQLKQEVIGPELSNYPSSLRLPERLWAQAEGTTPRRRHLPANDLHRAQAEAGRALVATLGPDRHAQFGRGSRAVPGPRAGRVRDRPASQHEAPRRQRQARPARGNEGHPPSRDPRAAQAGLRHTDGRVAARPVRHKRPTDHQGLNSRKARPDPHRAD